MTTDEAKALRPGDYVRTSGYLRGYVDVVTTNYVKIQWRTCKQGDIVARKSPLWQFIEREP